MGNVVQETRLAIQLLGVVKQMCRGIVAGAGVVGTASWALMGTSLLQD